LFSYRFGIRRRRVAPRLPFGAGDAQWTLRCGCVNEEWKFYRERVKASFDESALDNTGHVEPLIEHPGLWFGSETG